MTRTMTPDQVRRQEKANAESDRIAATYGVYSPPPDIAHSDAVHESGVKVSWDDPRLDRITTLRLISDPGFPLWDVSYCHGELKDGTACRVTLPFHQLPKGRGATVPKDWIVREAKRSGVFAKGLGLLDDLTYSTLN